MDTVYKIIKRLTSHINNYYEEFGSTEPVPFYSIATEDDVSELEGKTYIGSGHYKSVWADDKYVYTISVDGYYNELARLEPDEPHLPDYRLLADNVYRMSKLKVYDYYTELSSNQKYVYDQLMSVANLYSDIGSELFTHSESWLREEENIELYYLVEALRYIHINVSEVLVDLRVENVGWDANGEIVLFDCFGGI